MTMLPPARHSGAETEATPLRPSQPGAELGFVRPLTAYDLMISVRKYAWLVALCGIVVAAAVFIWMSVTPPLYTASAVIGPVLGRSGDTDSSTFGQLAALAGGGLLPDSGDGPFIRFQELIMSERVARSLSTQDELLSTIFDDEWDAENKTWVRPTGPVGRVVAWLYEAVGVPSWEAPGPQRLKEYIGQTLRIRDVPRTSLKEMSFTFKDPAFARYFLVLVHDEADRLIRESERRRVEENIKYLGEQLTGTLMTEQRTAIVDILTRQHQNLMLISQSGPFAAEFIDPPNVSDLPTSPRPPIYLLAAVALGLLLGIVLATYLHWKKLVARAIEAA